MLKVFPKGAVLGCRGGSEGATPAGRGVAPSAAEGREHYSRAKRGPLWLKPPSVPAGTRDFGGTLGCERPKAGGLHLQGGRGIHVPELDHIVSAFKPGPRLPFEDQAS